MGSQTGYLCQACGTRFEAHEGGGFMFDRLHCERCGAEKNVAHRDLGDVHLAFVKGLAMPHAIARTELDREIQRDLPRPARDGGRVPRGSRGDAPALRLRRMVRIRRPVPRPHCGSTEQRWTPTGQELSYD